MGKVFCNSQLDFQKPFEIENTRGSGVFITKSDLLKTDIPKEELIQILEALILKIKLSKLMKHFESGKIKQSCRCIFVQ